MESQPTAPAQHTDDKKLPSAFTLFEGGVQVFKVNPGPLFGLIFTPLAIIIPLFIIIGVFAGATSANGGESISSTAASIFAFVLFILYLGAGAVAVMLGGAFVSALLKSVKQEKTTYGESFRVGLHYFWRFLGLSICVGLLVVLGFILLIVPGLFMLKRYLLSPYYLIDQNMGVFEAMKQSAADTNKVGGTWGVVGVTALINLVGLVPFVGWIASTVGSVLYVPAPAIRYEQVKKAVAQAR